MFYAFWVDVWRFFHLLKIQILSIIQDYYLTALSMNIFEHHNSFTDCFYSFNQLVHHILFQSNATLLHIGTLKKEILMHLFRLNFFILCINWHSQLITALFIKFTSPYRDFSKLISLLLPISISFFEIEAIIIWLTWHFPLICWHDVLNIFYFCVCTY